MVEGVPAWQAIWAEIPWIGLRDPLVAPSFQNGVYVVYLYVRDLSGVYLSLNQGVTAVREVSGFRAAGSILRERADQLRSTLNIPSQFGNHQLMLRANGENGLLYEAGHICGLSYPAASKITTKLERDLEALISLYSSVCQILRPAAEADPVAVQKSSLARETEEFLERAAFDISTDVQSGTETHPTLVRRRKRQQALRKALLHVYEPKCAACELSFKVAETHMLHAAHVIDVEDHGASVVRNGILLCPHDHWAFDRGCWTITADYRIKVHPRYSKYDFLSRIDGKRLAEPRDCRFRIDPKAIAIRQRKWESPLGKARVIEDRADIK